MYRSIGKRLFDLGIVLLVGIPLLPVALGIALWVRLRMGAPVLFRQERRGLDGRPFRLVKFRTMRDLRDPEGRLLPDEARLTPFGAWLRATSLDELPELWNVLTGDMSLVGPRPLLPVYWDRYSPEQRRRHEVRPGITGWAQVHGRNGISWERKFALDVWYVDHLTFGVDVKVLLRTVRQVLSREGISQEGYATAPEFRGSSGVT